MGYGWTAIDWHGKHIKGIDTPAGIVASTRLAALAFTSDDTPVVVQQFDDGHVPKYEFDRGHHVFGWWYNVGKRKVNHTAILNDNGGPLHIASPPSYFANGARLEALIPQTKAVEPSGYSWVAVYSDWSIFEGVDCSTGERRSTQWIDRPRLLAFALVNPQCKPIIIQHVDGGDRFIYRRRTSVEQGTRNYDFMQIDTCHLMGWQKDIGGRVCQSMAYAFEGYHIELAGAWRNDHPWFYSIAERDITTNDLLQT